MYYNLKIIELESVNVSPSFISHRVINVPLLANVYLIYVSS